MKTYLELLRWLNDDMTDWCNQLAHLDTTREVAEFLHDIMGRKEVLKAAKRMKAAKLLLKGKTQRQAAKEVGLSPATVNRVAQRMQDGFESLQRWFGPKPSRRHRPPWDDNFSYTPFVDEYNEFAGNPS